MSASRPSSDPLAAACRSLRERLPIDAVVLAGSRATGNTDQDSDYDLLAVMRTWPAVRHFKALKREQARLATELQAPVTLNPLLWRKVRRARGNLFLFKVKREGVVVDGPDVIGVLQPGSLRQMPVDRFLSFLFSISLRLAACAPDAAGSLTQKNARTVRKCLLDCAQLHLMLHGEYRRSYTEVLDALRTGPSATEESRRMAADMEVSLGPPAYAPPRLTAESWFVARKYLGTAFSRLVPTQEPVDFEHGIPDGHPYANPPFEGLFQRVEYTALRFLHHGELRWFNIVARMPARRRLRIALIWLLSSVRTDGSVDPAALDEARALIAPLGRFPARADDLRRELETLTDCIREHWTASEVVLGA